MEAFHFIRPAWFILWLPFVVLAWVLLRQKTVPEALRGVCDSHLLKHLLVMRGVNRRMFSLGFLFLSVSFAIVALAGPTWSRWPVPTYQPIQPRVLVLDMSDTMSMTDVAPDRLQRAKFKLHDLFQQTGQWGLIVYTGESFVVSPLTDDGQTIDALLSSLTPDVMPVEGEQLNSALLDAQKLIRDAGFSHGQVLVLTGSPPSGRDVATAKTLARAGIETSILPVVGQEIRLGPMFQRFATAGHGQRISLTHTDADIKSWLVATHNHQQYGAQWHDDIPVWRDQGRWFLIPALAFLLPVFRRGWLQGIGT